MVNHIERHNNKFIFLIQPKADIKSGKLLNDIKLIEWDYPFQSNNYIENQLKIKSSTFFKYIKNKIIINDTISNKLILYDNYKKQKVLKLKNQTNNFSITSNFKYLSVVLKNKINLYNLENMKLLKKYQMEYACYVDFSPNNDYILLGSWNLGYIFNIEDFIIN